MKSEIKTIMLFVGICFLCRQNNGTKAIFEYRKKVSLLLYEEETLLTEKGNKEKTSQKVTLGTTYRCQIKLMHVTLLA